MIHFVFILLGIEELLESVAQCLSSILENNGHFLKYCFWPVLFLLSFWDSSYTYVRSFPLSNVSPLLFSVFFICVSILQVQRDVLSSLLHLQMENWMIIEMRLTDKVSTKESLLLWWLSGEESACPCKREKRCGFFPWVGKIPLRRKWQPTPVFLPGKSHGRGAWWGVARVRHDWSK